jgi:hypothetical protein
VYPRIDSTDLDELRLLAIFGEVGSPGTSTKNRERWLLSNSAVLPTFRWTGRRCETSTRLRFTKYGQEPNGIKLGRIHDLFYGASEILGFFKHLLYVWASKPLWSRR